MRIYTRPLQVAYAEYELDAIMLTGSCTEYAPGKQLPPPKGLELNLGAEQQPHMVRASPCTGRICIGSCCAALCRAGLLGGWMATCRHWLAALSLRFF